MLRRKYRQKRTRGSGSGDGNGGLFRRFWQWRKRRQGFSNIADDNFYSDDERKRRKELQEEQECPLVLKSNQHEQQTSYDIEDLTPTSISEFNTPTNTANTTSFSSATTAQNSSFAASPQNIQKQEEELSVTALTGFACLPTMEELRAPSTITWGLRTPPRLSTFHNEISAPPPSSLPLHLIMPSSPSPYVRNRTEDSFHGSLMSLDSLVESCWDPDDDEEDESFATPIVNNAAGTTSKIDDFLSEHVKFLKVQTQPREVEVVYHNPESGVR